MASVFSGKEEGGKGQTASLPAESTYCKDISERNTKRLVLTSPRESEEGILVEVIHSFLVYKTKH